MSSENKSREFWIGIDDNFAAIEVKFSKEDAAKDTWYNGYDSSYFDPKIIYHVIDYKEYQSALDEIKKRDETIAAFREALELASDKNRYYAAKNHKVYEIIEKASEVLAKYPKEIK